jgi:hypothetical protein
MKKILWKKPSLMVCHDAQQFLGGIETKSHDKMESAYGRHLKEAIIKYNEEEEEEEEGGGLLFNRQRRATS